MIGLCAHLEERYRTLFSDEVSSEDSDGTKSDHNPSQVTSVSNVLKIDLPVKSDKNSPPLSPRSLAIITGESDQRPNVGQEVEKRLMKEVHQRGGDAFINNQRFLMPRSSPLLAS